MKVTVIPIVIGAVGSYQMIGAGTGGLGIERMSKDHPNQRILKGDFSRLAVTQTPLRNHRLIWGEKLKKE